MGPKKHLLLVAIFVKTVLVRATSLNEAARPNVVLIVADDLGYGDLGCFGNTTIRTPHLDRLAAEGVKLTHNVAAASICTPSRAAFLTGRYSIRSGMIASHHIRAFIFTAASCGLPASEVTIGEVAKKAGYRTAFLGKWHQGWSVDRSDPNHPHPLNQGFDYFYGVPLTNIPDFGDSSTSYKSISVHLLPNLPFQIVLSFLFVLLTTIYLVRRHHLHLWSAVLLLSAACLLTGTALFSFYYMKLLNSFMFRNYDIVEQPIHLPSVTRKLVKEGEEFLQARHADHAPFLLLVSWLHVHTALATAPEFRGQSAHGPYGDAVEEMDWGVGQLMEMLERLGMVDNTLVYFTSDHGALPQARDLTGRVTGGFNGLFNGGKGDGSTEGSFRVPGIVRWPGHVPAGVVVREPVSLMDVLPTVAELLNVSDVTVGHVVDGVSMVPLLRGEERVSPHEFLFHYCQDSVHAVTYRPRLGTSLWKLMFREPDPNTKDFTAKCNEAIHLDPPTLYDLSADPTASSPVPAEEHPQVVSAILKAVRQHQDSVQEVPSQFAWWRMMWQPWNQPCCNFPKCACEDEKFKGLFTD
ncbi:steryl-sulfatase-like [Babylonia areolata]|uniref:steryl-sulfatase-like n=1 Tax=Babylonia areolata TaxID=304850 RepID=UPI003FD417AA